MKLYTLGWSRGKIRKNVLTVNVKFADENGKTYIFGKTYREWFGVLTNDVKPVLKKIKRKFDACSCQKLNDRRYKTIAPLFADRLESGEEEGTEGKFFYKIYTDRANVHDVGTFFEREGFVSYHSRDAWLTRVYIDFANKFDTETFYYNWYEVNPDESDLLESFEALYAHDTRLPPISIASFDLETVPWEVGSTRFPKGFHPNDVIVMISLVTGAIASDGRVETVSKELFYLNPLPGREDLSESFPGYRCFDSESELIAAFLRAIDKPNVLILTGYNVVGFDLPCLFARLNFLRELRDYRNKFTSFDVGKHTVVTFRKKIVLDMYSYFELSKGEFDSLKLDDVAKARLKRSRKIPIHATAIHKWYQARDKLTLDVLTSRDPDSTYDFVQPGFSNRSSFGTFETCLDYCLRDSELVMDLLTEENAVSFLIARSNITALNVEQVLYLGKSKYIENAFETYGTRLGYFVQIDRLRNVDGDGPHRFLDYAGVPAAKRKNDNAKYQGALNFGKEASFHRGVSCYDFESLYPSCIMAFNVSYETFAVLHVDTWRRLSARVGDRCRCVPFAVHGERDFFEDATPSLEEHEGLVMVYANDGTSGFLPTVLKSLLNKRRESKRLVREDPENYVYHFNNQLSFKLIMNSAYGCLGAANDISIACLGLAMSVTYFGRELLLSSYRYLTRRGYEIPYCDTDSLFVVDRNERLERDVNRHLNLEPYVNLQFEKRFAHFLVLTKKKYCFENEDGSIASKGFEKKSNELTKRMVADALRETFEALKRGGGGGRDPSSGWAFLVRLLREAFCRSRNNKNYTTRNVKALEEYSERSTAPQVRLMKREKNFFSSTKSIQFVYVFTDVSVEEDKNHNPVFAESIGPERDVDFEKLYSSQKTNVLMLLNMAFFEYDQLDALVKQHDRIVQWMRWKQVIHSALFCKRKFGEDLLVMYSKSVRFTFKIIPSRREASATAKRRRY